MKRFFIQTTILSAIVLSIFVFVISRTDGYMDPFYLRFTTGKQQNLLLGTSRAAQGLVTDIFDKKLSKKFFNYSFTLIQSPYGPTYLQSIQKKLDINTKDGIFILSVDPWSISTNNNEPDNPDKFPELKHCLNNTWNVNMNPNLFYLINNNSFGKYVQNLYAKRDTSTYLHKNGWLEISVDMRDSIASHQKVLDKIEAYRKKNLPVYKFSKLRLEYLIKTIKFLKQHGKVYLVRIPVHPLMMDIENELMPDFNTKIQAAVTLSNGYLDLTSENHLYKYTDGNHLLKYSGKAVSEKIADWMLKQ
jgi:hypothetical protein